MSGANCYNVKSRQTVFSRSVLTRFAVGQSRKETAGFGFTPQTIYYPRDNSIKFRQRGVDAALAFPRGTLPRRIC